MTDDRHPTRRALLVAGATAGSVATAGCLRDLRSILTTDSPSPLSLSITVRPASEDPVPVTIADRLRAHLEAVGIDTSVRLREAQEFRRDVLLNHDFDLAIGTHPGLADPDALYGLLHSRYGPERGWQNPYGWDDLDADVLLAQQRHDGPEDRTETVATLLERIAQERPLHPLWIPVRRRAVDTDRVVDGADRPFDDASDILAIELADPDATLSATIRAIAPTQNLNPLSIEHRDRGLSTGLVYDPLVRVIDGEGHPWLANSIEWTDDGATVSLREASWHDGEPVSADDVAFTYELLADTSRGDAPSPVPAPRFIGRRSLVDAIDVVDDRTVELAIDAVRPVADRALTVPILPAHVWADRTGEASVEGIAAEETLTEALVVDNLPPVGSGPYAFDDATDREHLHLERVDEHAAMTADELASVRPLPPRIELRVSPNDGTSTDWVADGTADLTIGPLLTSVDGGDLPASVELVETATSELYHVAMNTRSAPLSNTNVRRVLSHLIDTVTLAEEVPAESVRPRGAAMADAAWIPGSLAVDRVDPEVPFLGEGDELDLEAARAAFRDIGYQYDDEDRLVSVGD